MKRYQAILFDLDGTLLPMDVEAFAKIYIGALAKELALLERVKAALEDGKPARSLEYDEDEMAVMKEIALISMKPVIYVANINEDELGTDLTKNPHYMALKAIADEEKSGIISICAGIEAEISELGRVIREAIAKLPQKERTIIEYRFYRNMQVKEIAEQIGLSSSRITRIIQSSLNTVREYLNKKDHYDY